MFIIGGAAWFYTSPAPSVRSVIIIIPSPSVNILRRQYLQMYFLYSVFSVMESWAGEFSRFLFSSLVDYLGHKSQCAAQGDIEQSRNITVEDILYIP